MALLVIQKRDTRAGRKKKVLYPGFGLPFQFIDSLIQTCHPPTHLGRQAWIGGWGRAQAPGGSAFPYAWLTQKHVMKADITSNTIRSFG